MFEKLLRQLGTIGWHRGRSGSRTWLIVAAVAGGLRLLGRVTREHEEVLYRTLVVAGDQFEIVTKAPGKR
jgi:hypothetical protein